MKRIILVSLLVLGLVCVPAGVSAAGLQPSAPATGIGLDPGTSANIGDNLQGGGLSYNQGTQSAGLLNSVQPNQTVPVSGVFSKQNIMSEADPNYKSQAAAWPLIVLSAVIALAIILGGALLFRQLRHKQLHPTS